MLVRGKSASLRPPTLRVAQSAGGRSEIGPGRPARPKVEATQRLNRELSQNSLARPAVLETAPRTDSELVASVFVAATTGPAPSTPTLWATRQRGSGKAGRKPPKSLDAGRPSSNFSERVYASGFLSPPPFMTRSQKKKSQSQKEQKRLNNLQTLTKIPECVEPSCARRPQRPAPEPEG